MGIDRGGQAAVQVGLGLGDFVFTIANLGPPEFYLLDLEPFDEILYLALNRIQGLPDVVAE